MHEGAPPQEKGETSSTTHWTLPQLDLWQITGLYSSWERSVPPAYTDSSLSCLFPSEPSEELSSSSPLSHLSCLCLSVSSSDKLIQQHRRLVSKPRVCLIALLILDIIEPGLKNWPWEWQLSLMHQLIQHKILTQRARSPAGVNWPQLHLSQWDRSPAGVAL